MNSDTFDSVYRLWPLTNFQGGSTVILLFQPGTFVFDDDLVTNSHQSLETLATPSFIQANIRFVLAKALDIILVFLKSSVRTRRKKTSRKRIFGMRLEGLVEVLQISDLVVDNIPVYNEYLDPNY